MSVGGVGFAVLLFLIVSLQTSHGQPSMPGPAGT